MKCSYHAEGLCSLGVVGVPVQKCTRIKDWGRRGAEFTSTDYLQAWP